MVVSSKSTKLIAEEYTMSDSKQNPISSKELFEPLPLPKGYTLSVSKLMVEPVSAPSVKTALKLESKSSKVEQEKIKQDVDYELLEIEFGIIEKCFEDGFPQQAIEVLNQILPTLDSIPNPILRGKCLYLNGLAEREQDRYSQLPEAYLIAAYNVSHDVNYLLKAYHFSTRRLSLTDYYYQGISGMYWQQFCAHVLEQERPSRDHLKLIYKREKFRVEENTTEHHPGHEVALQALDKLRLEFSPREYHYKRGGLLADGFLISKLYKEKNIYYKSPTPHAKPKLQRLPLIENQGLKLLDAIREFELALLEDPTDLMIHRALCSIEKLLYQCMRVLGSDVEPTVKEYLGARFELLKKSDRLMADLEVYKKRVSFLLLHHGLADDILHIIKLVKSEKVLALVLDHFCAKLKPAPGDLEDKESLYSLLFSYRLDLTWQYRKEFRSSIPYTDGSGGVASGQLKFKETKESVQKRKRFYSVKITTYWV